MPIVIGPTSESVSLATEDVKESQPSSNWTGTSPVALLTFANIFSLVTMIVTSSLSVSIFSINE